MTFNVLHASTVRESGIMRVEEVDRTGNEFGDSQVFFVVGEPDKKLVFRSGRPVYDDDGRLKAERIFIVEKPDFDITVIVGKQIVCVGKQTDESIGERESETAGE